MKLPTHGEFLYLATGIGIGLVCGLIINVSRDVVFGLLLAGLLGGSTLLLVTLLREAKRDHDRSEQRVRDIEAEGWWLKTANRAATSKHVGLGWAGRHSGRRSPPSALRVGVTADDS
jgi:hypothetical protein